MKAPTNAKQHHKQGLCKHEERRR